MTAMAQSAPGILAVNMAIFSGYKLRSYSGAAVAALGAVLPSFVIILLVAMCFRDFRQNPWVERIFCGVRPAVVALIAVPVFRLARSAGVTLRNSWWPVLCALTVWWWKVSPVYVVMVAAVGGYLFCRGSKK